NGILKGRQGADYNLTIRRGSSGTTQTAAQKTPHVSYRTHVQSYGWQNYVKDGSMSGTEGKSKRLEGINIMLPDKPYSGGITYRTHVQTYGWQSWRSDDQMAGTQGESKRLEAIQIKLTGEMANHFDVYYQTHIQKFGWSGWAKNGEQCGSAGYSYRLEGIRIRLVNKGAAAPGSTTNIFYEKNAAAASGSGAYKRTLIRYNTHVQSYGWQNYVTDGKMAGTSGQSKRLEGIHIELTDVPCSGGVTYRTHVQTYGWQGWKSNGEMSGTSGQSKRLEAIEIKLTGEMANRYDIYYRVHAQTYGWLDWAKNGASAGTSGLSRRLEGIEIRLVKKGGAAPGSTARPYVKANTSKTNYETIYGSTLNGLQNARVSGNTRYTAYDLCDVNSDGIKDLIVFDSNGYMTMAQKLEVYSYMGGRVVKLGTIDIHIGSIRLSGNAIFVANTGFWGIAIRKYVYRNGKFEDTLLYTTKDNPTAAGNGVPANITEWHGAREMNLNTKDLSDRTVLRRA
ncbi:MAG: hypothetical protein J5973_10055, partial [Eubacterium sp.]|nr:hypothetical protein [Eubacterium sp.]